LLPIFGASGIPSGVGHVVFRHRKDEEAFPAVARADFRRREQSRLKPITQVE
jgi:hypothetical protein